MKENKDELDIKSKPSRNDLHAQKFQQPPNIQEECVISKIYPVRQPFWLLLIEILAYLGTAGVLLILIMWIKRLRFQLFFLITTMDKAEKIAVFGPDNDVQIAPLVKAKASNNSLKQFSLLTSNPDTQQKIVNDEEHQFNNNSTTGNVGTAPKTKSVFDYRFYKYQYIQGEFVPYGFLVSNYKNSEFLQTYKNGLSEEQIIDSYERNGQNNTDIPDKGLLMLIFEDVVSPFYLFQIGSTILWFFEGYIIYAYIIIITSTISTIFRIYEERKNFNRLKKFSYFRCQTEVIRSGKKISIDSQKVGFGEKIVLKEGQIAPCDVVVSVGSAIVNEAMLTGESIPIVKTALSDNSDMFQENKQNVIYCGSQIQQVSHNLECLVIRVGFDTLKGNLIRSIMYPKHHNQLSFSNDSGKFIVILFFVAFLSFIVSIKTFLDKYDRGEIEQKDVIIRLLDLVTISVPPALPTCLSFGISFSLKRMNKKKVFCINPEKINICGIVKTICFDKTGTLTEEKLSFKLVSAYDQSTNFVEQKNAAEMGQLQKMIMSSCHSLMFFQGKNAGDPLDIEMFESTGSAIVPENIKPLCAEISGNAVISEMSLNGDLQDRSENNTIAILKRFQFESEVERMSAIISVSGKCFVVTKGSPEKLLTICKPESIPKNFNQNLKSFTQEGQRVIALSYKPINPAEINGEKERIHFENDLIFAGFLVFENKLKPETFAHIELLQNNGIQIHMVTGDNPLTSLSVAKQCQLLSSTADISVLDVIEERNEIKSTLNGLLTPLEGILPLLQFGNNQFVMTGNFFKHFLLPLKVKEDPALPNLLSLTKVYARMKPDQKQSLIRLFQTNQNAQKAYSFIGMCGDGANDCQALKDADMGISLGEAEASIAASFTSKVVNISIIEFILREGRCCLATSFQCFKFMALYSIIQCSTTGILYQRGAIPGDYQFLYWDLFIIVPLAFLIGLTEASSKLTKNTPSHRLFSHTNLFSVVGLGLIQFFFLVISIVISASQDWYYSPLDITKIGQSDPSVSIANSFDNAILFWVSNFQYIFSVVAFSLGSEHKKKFYTNLPFTAFLIAIIILSIYALFSRELSFTEFFDISAIAYDVDGNGFSVMPYWWRFIMGALIVVNTITVIVYEKYILKIMISAFEKNFPSFVYQGIFTGQLRKNPEIVSNSNSADQGKVTSPDLNRISSNQDQQTNQL